MFCVGSRARRRIKTPSLTPPVSRLRGCVRLQTRHRRRLWCRLRCPQGATGQGIEAPGVSWRLSHHVARDRARHRRGDGWSAYATHRPVCCALRFLLNSCGWTGGGCGPVKLGVAPWHRALLRTAISMVEFPVLGQARALEIIDTTQRAADACNLRRSTHCLMLPQSPIALS